MQQEKVMATPRRIACADHDDGDCEIILAADTHGNGRQPVQRVGCRREALASAAYFAMLFARTRPTEIDREDRSLLAYTISVPFDTDAVVFLLHRLHRRGRRNGPMGLRCDPAQAVGASLFFGMSPEWIECLVVDLLRALTKQDIKTTTTATVPNHARVVTDHATIPFALCLLESDLVGDIKTRLWRRFAYLLPVALAPWRHGQCYNPRVACASVRSDDGALWHAVRLAFDGLGHGTNRATCADIELTVSLVFEGTSEDTDSDGDPNAEAGDRCDVILCVHSAPAGEQLGGWPQGDPFPAGALRAAPCAMRARVRLYHPTRGLVVDDAQINSWSGASTLTRRDPKMAGLRHWGVPVPHGFDRASQNGTDRARRAARTSTIATGVDPRDRALWACEVALFLRPHDQPLPAAETPRMEPKPP